jgi:DnaK suppressor protein
MAHPDARARVREVVRRLSALAADVRSDLAVPESQWAHEQSSADNHPADNASDVLHREMDVGLTRGLEHHLAEARRAMEKMEEHTYGRCDRCGRDISAARLEARPESVLCLACADAEERYRPPEGEAVVPSPSGRTCAEDPVEATGRDFTEAVMRWGSSNSTQDTPPAVDAEEAFVGFDDPEDAVEPIERYVDESGEVLWDVVRAERRIRGQSTQQADASYGDDIYIGDNEADESESGPESASGRDRSPRSPGRPG